MDGHEGYRVNSLRRGALIWSTILIAFITAMVVAAARHVAIVEINKLLDNELQQIAVNAGQGLSLRDKARRSRGPAWRRALSRCGMPAATPGARSSFGLIVRAVVAIQPRG